MSVAVALRTFNQYITILGLVIGQTTTAETYKILLEELLAVIQQHVSEALTLLQTVGFVMNGIFFVWKKCCPICGVWLRLDVCR